MNNAGSEKRVVLVTGASSGIGRGLAMEFARRGWSVALMARREDVLKKIAEEVAAVGAEALCVPADVTDAKEVQDGANRIFDQWGHVDTLIANAGIASSAGAADFDPAEVTRVINTNLVGAVNSVAAVIGEMLKRQRGHLVAVSSLAAYRGLPKSGAYCASKAGLSAFFESLRIDLRGTGVDVTIIHPGFIKTALTAGRQAKMPYLMELPDAVSKMMRAIEGRRKSYSFPWQLASIVRSGLLMPAGLYDRIAAKNSFRE
jgi:NADP-dependent 3-hydroxy acid dehydrogenase YdfG